jgi:hypothetical protein
MDLTCSHSPFPTLCVPYSSPPPSTPSWPTAHAWPGLGMRASLLPWTFRMAHIPLSFLSSWVLPLSPTGCCPGRISCCSLKVPCLSGASDLVSDVQSPFLACMSPLPRPAQAAAALQAAMKFPFCVLSIDLLLFSVKVMTTSLFYIL